MVSCSNSLSTLATVDTRPFDVCRLCGIGQHAIVYPLQRKMPRSSRSPTLVQPPPILNRPRFRTARRGGSFGPISVKWDMAGRRVLNSRRSLAVDRVNARSSAFWYACAESTASKGSQETGTGGPCSPRRWTTPKFAVFVSRRIAGRIGALAEVGGMVGEIRPGSSPWKRSTSTTKIGRGITQPRSSGRGLHAL